MCKSVRAYARAHVREVSEGEIGREREGGGGEEGRGGGRKGRERERGGKGGRGVTVPF